MITQSYAFETQISMEEIPQNKFETVCRPIEITQVDGLPDCQMGENDVFLPQDEPSVLTQDEPSVLTQDETFYDISDVFYPEPSAPPIPTSSHALLAWYLLDENVPEEEISPELITQIESLWFQITGHPFAMYLADGELLNIIQNLQFREHQIQRLYNNGHPTSRERMMGLHARFFEEFGCRISDFHNNESFKRMTDAVLAEQFV